MKKKILMTVIVLGVFFIASCDNSQNLLDDKPRNLDFVQEDLKAGATVEGNKAGSFSTEGGSGAIVYSLVSGDGDNDNDKFTVEGSLLRIKL